MADRTFAFPTIPLDVQTVRDARGVEWFRLSEDSDGRGARWSRPDETGCWLEPDLMHGRGPLSEVADVVYRWITDALGRSGLERAVATPTPGEEGGA